MEQHFATASVACEAIDDRVAPVGMGVVAWGQQHRQAPCDRVAQGVVLQHAAGEQLPSERCAIGSFFHLDTSVLSIDCMTLVVYDNKGVGRRGDRSKGCHCSAAYGYTYSRTGNGWAKRCNRSIQPLPNWNRRKCPRR